jgi:uncharacterized protein YkwD
MRTAELDPAPAIRARMAFALLAGLALALAPLSASPALADDWPAAWAEAELQMIEHINADRRAQGLGALRLDPDVREVARDWSQTMPEDGFRHREQFWTLYPDGYRSGGENIGYSSMRTDLETTTRWMHGALMDSPGHHTNIVNDSFTHVGVGVFVDRDNLVWFTVNFMGHPERAASEPEPKAGDYAFGSSSDDPTSDEKADDDTAAPSEPDDETAEEKVTSRFSDVLVGNVHAPAILRMADEGVISGYDDGTFRPSASVSRAQLATLLVRQLELTLDGEATSFSDLGADHPHADNVAIAASHGLVGGYDDGTFRPGRALTRAQAATMLVRAFEVASAAGGHDFSDVDAANVHGGAIAAAAEHGMVGGYDDGTFRPGQALTRAQIATILDRLRD